MVHAMKSLHWLANVQGVQPEITAFLQEPPLLQESVVQALWSSQSETVVQGLQWERKTLLQTPELHESAVQAFWSLQSAAVVQGLQASSAALEQMPPSQES